jgi:hypothetical protein
MCNNNERVLNAHFLRGRGIVIINSDRQAIYRPARVGQAARFVLICISK